MREVIAIAVLCMGLVCLMGAVITYNAPPREVSCLIELQYTDHAVIYAGKGVIHD